MRWMRRLGYVLAALAVVYLGAALYFQRTNPRPTLDAAATTAFTPAWPSAFLWGTATAAHQVEGGNVHNDWWRFEQQAGKIAHGDRSGAAAGHWERVAEDVGLMRSLGATAYRFSLEWSRLEPVEGQWDETAWAHYGDEIAQLRAAGQEPVVTLLHFTLPAWIADRGGATAPDFPDRFGRFAAEAARRFGPQVKWWCTVNEPQVQMYNGYVTGYWPPGVKDHALAVRAFAGLLAAHASAAAALRAGDADAFIGLASNMIWFEPANRWNLLEWFVSNTVAEGFNWSFYESIRQGRQSFSLPGFPSLDVEAPALKGSVDWVGINYYRRNTVTFSPGSPGMVEIGNGPGTVSDAKVEIFPEGLLGLVREGWKRYRLPIVITEYGVADSTGAHRPAFIRQHAYAVKQAIDEGVDVRGAFHWSLMDNFEWAEGYGWRFGLYRLDLKTLARTPAPGAEEFSRLAPRPK
ncbi:MAG: family 1 glycosylhydrolase [Gemmatimonadetes bacterium]|nr:family 1 glycosylhydrolase [Gemmatimonadota bacterium]